MPIDVAGEDEITQWTAFAPAAKDVETGVRGRSPVEIEAVAEETPSLLRISSEPDGVGDFLEPLAAEGRVGPPETLGAAEIGQTGVNAHARPGTDQEGVGGEDGLRRMLASIFQIHQTIHVLPFFHPSVGQSQKFFCELDPDQ